MDRRWKWKFGWVRGRYNVRQTKEPLVLRNEKKPKELLELLLKEMGETKWKMVDIPNDTRPFVDWDEPATSAIQRLLEELNCRIWLDPVTNLVTIGKSHVGMQLPINQLVMSDTVTIHAPDCPPMKFLSGPALWQDDLELEAVAECPDTNSVKPLAEVQYIKNPPIGGNLHLLEPPFFGNLPEQYRTTAQKCIWRWYRVKEPIEVSIGNKKNFKINNRWQILPLQKTALESEKHGAPVVVQYPWEKEEIRKPAIVIGKFDGEKIVATPEPTFTDSRRGKLAKWMHGFTLDAERGIVQLGGVCKLTDQATAKTGPAELYLRVGFGIRDKTTEAWDRWSKEWKPQMKTMDTPVHIVARQDVQLLTFMQWPDHGFPAQPTFFCSEKYVEEQADFYLKQELQRFVLETPGQRKYAGLVFYPLDGAIQQVTWDIDLSGRCTTILSRNREDPERSLTYKELRERTLIDALVKKDSEHKSRNPDDDRK
jgi:hypothetical protein